MNPDEQAQELKQTANRVAVPQRAATGQDEAADGPVGAQTHNSPSEGKNVDDGATSQNGKHPGGRPSVVTEELLELARRYVESGWSSHKLANGRKVVYPMVEGLAIYLGISRETIYARDEFSDIVSALKAIQVLILANGGLDGSLNPVTTKLIMASKHGYVERTATESDNRNQNTNLDVTSLSDEEIDAKLAKLRETSKA